ncbi:MAG: DNA cytosine methyltransferase [Candidatus Bathyarchaeia archaeon]
MARGLDLFCGCGGLSLGFKMAGFNIVAGFDYDEYCVATRSHNIGPTFRVDLRQAFGKELLEKAGIDGVDVIIGGPPCEGFSIANVKRKVGDPRNMLIFHFARIVDELRPKFFVMENVVGLLSLGSGLYVRELLKKFTASGYKVQYRILNAADYGVPQFRRRVIFIGNCVGAPITFPRETHSRNGYVTVLGENLKPYVTVSGAISDLPDPTYDGKVFYDREPKTEYQRLMRSPQGWTTGHILTRHREDVVRRLKELKYGETLYPQFKHSWMRLDPNLPAPTVKENHNAPAVHPEQPRILTPRECARLQSFPDNFDFLAPKSIQLKLIGDAVPPLLAKAIAEEVKKRMAEV